MVRDNPSPIKTLGPDAMMSECESLANLAFELGDPKTTDQILDVLESIEWHLADNGHPTFFQHLLLRFIKFQLHGLREMDNDRPPVI